jgi:hypothetical protein
MTPARPRLGPGTSRLAPRTHDARQVAAMVGLQLATGVACGRCQVTPDVARRASTDRFLMPASVGYLQLPTI